MWFPASLATPMPLRRPRLWCAFIRHQLCASCVKVRRGQTQSCGVVSRASFFVFSFKNKWPSVLLHLLETTLDLQKVAASCCKLQIWFLDVGLGKKTKTKTAMYGLFRMWMYPRKMPKYIHLWNNVFIYSAPCIEYPGGKGRGTGADWEVLCVSTVSSFLPTRWQAVSY